MCCHSRLCVSLFITFPVSHSCYTIQQQNCKFLSFWGSYLLQFSMDSDNIQCKFVDLSLVAGHHQG